MKPKEEIVFYEKGIEELRRIDDEICDNCNRIRSKATTFLGGGLAILGFLYNEGTFTPDRLYGLIFYFIGLGSYITSLVLFFLSLKPSVWLIATDLDSYEKDKHSSYSKFLEYIKNEYIKVINHNLGSNNKRQGYLNLASLLLSLGAILLFIIKKFP